MPVSASITVTSYSSARAIPSASVLVVLPVPPLPLATANTSTIQVNLFLCPHINARIDRADGVASVRSLDEQCLINGVFAPATVADPCGYGGRVSRHSWTHLE